MIKYNLLTERWIPCILESNTFECFNLYDFFKNAHKIKGLSLENPLEHLSLLRFLQVFVFRAFGVEKGKGEWVKIWEEGNFAPEALESYVKDNNLRGRFNIFDDERPFYQAKSYFENLKQSELVKLKKAQSPASVIIDKSSGNNPILFEHSYDDSVFKLILRKLPIYLITGQNFALGGGGGKNKQSLMASKILFWIKENTIFKSLMLNSFYNPDLFQDSEDDKPIWEKSEETESSLESYPDGIYDYLTWQSRLLYIFKPENFEDAKETIENEVHLLFSKKSDRYFNILREQGRYIDKTEYYRDPIACLTKNENKSSNNPKDYIDLRFKKERMIWRDLNLILNVEKREDKPPRNLSFAKNNKRIIGRNKFYVDAYGNFNEKAGAFYQLRRETFKFYPEFLENQDKYKELVKFIEESDNTANRLRYVIKLFGALVNYPENVSDSGSLSLSREQREDVNQFVSFTKIEQNYWERLEIPFYNHLEQVAFKEDDDFSEIENSWLKTLRNAAQEAFDEYMDGLSGDAKTLKALSFARNYLSIINSQKRSE